MGVPRIDADAFSTAEASEQVRRALDADGCCVVERAAPVEVMDAIAEELADVLIYSFSLADTLDCDIGQIMLDKLAKNEARYPADKYRDRF